MSGFGELQDKCEPAESRPEQSPFDEKAWSERVVAAAGRHSAAQFELGDLLIEGDGMVGSDLLLPPRKGLRASDIERARMSDVYDAAERLTGLERDYLKTIASVARRIPSCIRVHDLTWSHHRLVANLVPDSDAETKLGWLRRAAENRWSVADLRRELKDSPATEPRLLERSLVVTVSLAAYETLKDIAAGMAVETDGRVSPADVAAEYLEEYCDGRKATPADVASRFLDGHCASDETQAQRRFEREKADDALYEKRRRNGLRVARDLDPLGLRLGRNTEL